MTCRFEEEYAGRQYPKSCPTCGLAGKCHKDYQQIKLTPEQHQTLGFTYVILDPSGKPEPGKAERWNRFGTGIPSQVLIAATKPKPQPYPPGAPWAPRAQEAVTEAAKPKLSRVKRATCLDILDALPDIHTEEILNRTLDALLEAIDSGD